MGQHFGNYELLEKIAVGGMAEIFLARASHGRGVTRQIVIKRIHPALSADENFVGMFIDEARLGVTMMHGNIVPVFDFGCVDGYYYLAMEHVDGRDLSALMGRARVVGVEWPVDIAIHIVMEVLEGLDYAHRKRDDQGRPLELVHRDVSPSNILVSRDGQVKLLDFGIARSLASEYETRTGIVKGKPGYMSPEQACGAAVDARADVWSCGAVLHELLTGAKVKDGRLSTSDERIDAVLERALAADPSARYTTARDFQEDLAAILLERSQRPTARDLAALVERIQNTSAPSEDWNLHAAGADLERHLAQALSRKPEREAAFPLSRHSVKRPETASPHAPEHTLRLSRGPWHPWMGVGIGLAAVALAAVAWAILFPRFAAESSVEVGRAAVPPIARAATVIAAQLRDSATTLPARSIPVASLTVTAHPTHTTIEVDGVLQGQGRIEMVRLPPGTHSLTFKAPGYATQQRQVELRPGGREMLTVVLAPRSIGKPPTTVNAKPTGWLSINTQPWSHVTIDGKNVGNTPLINLEVEAGTHTLVLTNPVRNLSRTLVVAIMPDEHKRIREVLDTPAP